jgi:hypothetical protein
MTASKWLLITGLALTLAGALILSWRDLRRGRGMKQPPWDDASRGFPRTEAKIGFPLIAVGSALQIAGVAIA